MSQIGQRYALPPEIDRFVDNHGFMKVVLEQPNEMNIEFHFIQRSSQIASVGRVHGNSGIPSPVRYS